MNRRQFLRCMAAVGIGAGVGGCRSASYAEKKGRKPNILVIVTDDQGYADLSAAPYKAADVSTPNMDRIAKEGILCTQAYVSAPVCSPSRAGWNTGKYQQRWNPEANWEPGLPKNVKTLAEYLKAAGYATAKFGKNDYGTNYHKMDVREYPLNHGYDEFLGFSAHAHDYFLLDEEIEKRTPDPKGTSAVLGPLFHNRTRKSFENAYTTDLFTDYAIDFIKRHKEEPFFVALTYNSLHHMIHEVPDKYLKKFNVPKIPNYDPSMGKYVDYYTKYRKIDPITNEQMRGYYLANLNCLDDNIGRVLDTLDELGLEEDTLIIFFSDNGGSPKSGQDNKPLRGSKYTMWEGGIRVVFMASWKGQLPKNRIYPYKLSSLDVVPTCLEAAGVQTDEGEFFDGESFLTALKVNKPSATESRPLFWKFQDQWAVRQGDFKLVKTSDKKAYFKGLQITNLVLQGPEAPEDRPMLYNIKEDISEQNDLYEKMPEKVKELQKLYDDWVDGLNISNKRRPVKKK